MTRVRHALVVRPDNAGDVLLAGPAIRAVAAGAERVTLWVGPAGAAASRLLPDVDHVVVRELPWIGLATAPVDRRWLDDTVDLAAALGVDAALVLSSFHQSPLPTALVLRAAGVPLVAATSVDHPGSLLDVRHQVDDDVHEVERALSLAAAAGFALPPGDDGRLRVTGLAEANPAADGTPYVVVNPGASVPARSYGPERNAAAVRALLAAGHRVVVTGGPAEVDLTAAVAVDGALDLGGRTDWATLARVLADADVVVTGNTGPAHLAAAVGTPVAALYAPTVPAVRWRPWMVPHVLLGDQGIACAGCRARECPFPGHPCLAGVSPGDVVAAVRSLGAVPHAGARPAGRSAAPAGASR